MTTPLPPLGLLLLAALLAAGAGLRAQTGTLAVLTDPPGATVRVDGVERGRTPVTVDRLPLGPKLRVQVERAGHRPAETVVELSASRPFATYEATLTPVVAGLAVFTVPGSKVTATGPDGQTLVLGLADADGRAASSEALAPGRYRLVASKPGFRDATADFDVAPGGGPGPELVPQPLPASVAFRSDPPGALVRAGGRDLGKTPLTVSLESGRTQLFTADAPGFATASRPVELTPNGSLVVDFGRLERRVGGLRLRLLVANVPGALDDGTIYQQLRVVVDGEARAVGGELVEGLGVGSRRVGLEHPDYEPVEAQMVEVLEGRTVNLAFTLRRKPAFVQLTLVPANPPNLQVFLNGTAVAPQDGRLPVNPGERFEITVSAKGYRQATVNAGPLAAGATSAQRVTLDPLPALLTFQLNPVNAPGLRLMVDGRNVANPNQPVSVTAGRTVAVEAGATGYDTLRRNVTAPGPGESEHITLSLARTPTAAAPPSPIVTPTPNPQPPPVDHTPKPPPTNTALAYVQLMGLPNSVEPMLSVNGVMTPHSNGRLPVPPARPLTIVLRAANFQERTFNLAPIAAGQTMTVTIAMEPSGGISGNDEQSVRQRIDRAFAGTESVDGRRVFLDTVSRSRLREFVQEARLRYPKLLLEPDTARKLDALATRAGFIRNSPFATEISFSP